MEKFRNIIVIGASAGGFNAIKQVIAQLPGSIDAAVFVVWHLSAQSNAQNLVWLWQKVTDLNCVVPSEGQKIEKGYLYIAPVNHHMLIKNDVIGITSGARENRHRPSIDVLFRSAAVYYGSRVIGIILTGLLADGTSGMFAIKKSGGICIVQDPAETEFPDMPMNVINRIDVDYRVRLNDMGYIINDILSRPLPEKKQIPVELQVESDITERMITSNEELKQIADPSDFICPDCGGRLWALRNDAEHRYRCHTGHVYSEKTLYDLQGKNLEESVWASIRILEEKRNMLNVMAMHAEDSSNTNLAEQNRKRANEVEKHIDGLKVILARLSA